MNTRLEDFLGKAILVAIFSILVALEIATITALINARATNPYWFVAVLCQVATVIFLSVTVFLTITRLPPKNSAAGVEPRATAFAGTFILMVFVFLPSGSGSTVLQLVATFLIVAGTSLSIACICWLGRSFSIMATARRLVIRGPYAFVRHPLYAAEAVTALGLVLARWSVFALMVGAAWFALQYRRSANEEAILRATFPEYEEYSKGVPRFFPISRKIHRLMQKAQDTLRTIASVE